MVKLQLLQHQMQSLQVSEEDSENFYLQQITLASKSSKELSDTQKLAPHTHSLVPLLSSRSTSPRTPPQESAEESKADREEEKISVMIDTTNSSRPSRLKPGGNQSA